MTAALPRRGEANKQPIAKQQQTQSTKITNVNKCEVHWGTGPGYETYIPRPQAANNVATAMAVYRDDDSK